MIPLHVCLFCVSSALVKVVKDNRVDTGVLQEPGAGRRGGRGQRNPKNILGIVASEASLGIPEPFKKFVGSWCYRRRRRRRFFCCGGWWWW